MSDILKTRKKATASGYCYSGLCAAARVLGQDFCIIAPDIEAVRAVWDKTMTIPLDEDKVYPVSFFRSSDVHPTTSK